MSTKGFVIALSLLAPLPAFSASVIYQENFTGQEAKGVTGGASNVTDLQGVTWGLDVSAASLSASTDWARVEEGVFEVRDADGSVVWSTPLIDIANFNSVAFALEASEAGNLESSDFIDVSYSLNEQAPELMLNWNGMGSSSHTLIGDVPEDTDWGSTALTLNGLMGDSLQIFVTMHNNAGAEYLRIDNILVTGELSPVPLPAAAYLFGTVILGGRVVGKLRKRRINRTAS